MDTTSLVIVISASLLFFGVLIYKAVWLIRKIQEEPPNIEKGPDNATPASKEPEPASRQDPQ